MDGGWWDAFVYYMGVWILMMFTFDYARFGNARIRHKRRFNFGMPFYLVTFLLNGVAGIYLVSTIPATRRCRKRWCWRCSSSWDWAACCSSGSRRPASIPPTTTWPINMQAFFARFSGMRWSKAVWAVAGAVTYALMLLDLFSYLLQAYQGIFVVSWVAVALVHILSGDDGTVSSGARRSIGRA